MKRSQALFGVFALLLLLSSFCIFLSSAGEILNIDGCLIKTDNFYDHEIEYEIAKCRSKAKVVPTSAAATPQPQQASQTSSTPPPARSSQKDSSSSSRSQDNDDSSYYRRSQRSSNDHKYQSDDGFDYTQFLSPIGAFFSQVGLFVWNVGSVGATSLYQIGAFFFDVAAHLGVFVFEFGAIVVVFLVQQVPVFLYHVAEYLAVFLYDMTSYGLVFLYEVAVYLGGFLYQMAVHLPGVLWMLAVFLGEALYLAGAFIGEFLLDAAAYAIPALQFVMNAGFSLVAQAAAQPWDQYLDSAYDLALLFYLDYVILLVIATYVLSRLLRWIFGGKQKPSQTHHDEDAPIVSQQLLSQETVRPIPSQRAPSAATTAAPKKRRLEAEYDSQFPTFYRGVHQ